MNSLHFCLFVFCVGVTFAENYAPSDGYEKCKVDHDCVAETCPSGQVSLCDVDKEECMCTVTGGGVCEFITCQHEGHCIVDSDADQGFDCHCQPGYEGPFCQHDKCDDVDCNNGDCVHDVTSAGGVKCECQDGWNGDFCDSVVVDLCQFVSCQHNADCENHPQSPGFTCHCGAGHSGTFCEEDKCDDVDCNNGNCVHDVTSAGGVKCECQDGWNGDFCNATAQGPLDVPTACTLDSDCDQPCDDGKEPFCSVPTFSCNCKSASSISCATHHDCSSACDVTLGLCMADGLCDCFHGLSNYFAHMIINKFPDTPPFIGSN